MAGIEEGKYSREVGIQGEGVNLEGKLFKVGRYLRRGCKRGELNPFVPAVPTFAVRETQYKYTHMHVCM